MTALAVPRTKPQFLIAAPHSGAGKTTITLGILKALTQRGLNVQPFKCGPDYLDPKLHAMASGQKSINLDRFMMEDSHLQDMYARYGSEADVSVTEGVMGLFDGAVKTEGSSADLARLLHIPIIMVINAKAMAYSVAALLLGFKTLCKDIHIAGVIFNFVQHESHYRILKEAAQDIGITALGYLPDHPGIYLPSRHLGLKTGMEIDHQSIIEQAADHIKEHIDLELLLQATRTTFHSLNHKREPIPDPAGITQPVQDSNKKKRLLVAYDEAFNFIYPENIRALSAIGEVGYFSPLSDSILPDADLIYLPGGYPELHLEALSANKPLINQLYAYHQNGGKILAECGGMMYLGKYITDEQGKIYPMVGLLDMATGMQQKKLSIGYKRLNIDGIVLHAHEFHYSQFIELPGSATLPAEEFRRRKLTVNEESKNRIKPVLSSDQTAVKVWNARNELLQLPVFKTKTVLASYFHLYFGDKINAIERLFFDT